MGAEIIAWSFASGWASGINAYGVVLVMGILGRFAGMEMVPDVLTRPDVMIAAAALTCLEFFADKIPYLDSVWDAVHTAIRPAVGATVSYLLANQTADMNTAFAAATGGFTALASHLVKSGIRLGVNASPEPVSNTLVSSAEDVMAATVVGVATAHPMLAAGIAGVLLVAGVALMIYLLWRLAGLKRRYDDWGTGLLRGGR